MNNTVGRDAPEPIRSVSKACVIFSERAFLKMMLLIETFSTEIAWHGTAKRFEGKDNVFYIDDILVYPQNVSSCSVDTEQEVYQDWLMSLDDDTFERCRMQGHSHVNMNVTPSGIDLGNQIDIKNQLKDDMFYIFMIWNKDFSSWFRIFDAKTNSTYENRDITFLIDGNILPWLENALEIAEAVERKEEFV